MTATIQQRPETTRRSKSDTPKSQREPYVPAAALFPVDTDYFASARYIDQQAAMGAFKGYPPGTVGTLHYLWRNTARNELEGETLGWVVSGKSNRAKIMTENELSRATAVRILAALESGCWIDKIIDQANGNKMYIRVRMDQDGHDARSRVLEGVGSDRAEGRLPQSIGSAQTEQTIQVFSQGFSQVILEGEEPKRENRKGKRQPLGSGKPLGSDKVSGSPARSEAASGKPDGVLDRTYFVWQSKGAWHVFNAAKPPKFEARNRQTVILSPAENAFYRKFFTGGAEANDQRALFLLTSQEERAEGIRQARLDRPDLYGELEGI